MSRSIKPCTAEQEEAVKEAEALLRKSLEKLKEADCPKTAERVRAALRSCGGARRHAMGRASRGEAQAASHEGAN